MFKYGDARRETQLKNSMVGLEWITETFGKLERVTFVESNVTRNSDVNELKSKAMTSKSGL